MPTVGRKRITLTSTTEMGSSIFGNAVLSTRRPLDRIDVALPETELEKILDQELKA